MAPYVRLGLLLTVLLLSIRPRFYVLHNGYPFVVVKLLPDRKRCNDLSQSKNEAMVYVVDQHANLMIWQASLILGNQQLVGCE